MGKEKELKISQQHSVMQASLVFHWYKQLLDHTQYFICLLYTSTNAFLKLLMILNLKYDQTAFDNDYAVGLIICHGYSTASSISNAANALLAEQVYVAFDMPLDVQVDEIVKKIDTYLNEKQFLDNALILVDMGSLELIGNKIRNRYDINIGIKMCIRDSPYRHTL